PPWPCGHAPGVGPGHGLAEPPPCSRQLAYKSEVYAELSSELRTPMSWTIWPCIATNSCRQGQGLFELYRPAMRLAYPLQGSQIEVSSMAATLLAPSLMFLLTCRFHCHAD